MPDPVLHARDGRRVPVAPGTELAARIPEASLVALKTHSHIPLSREPASQRIIGCIEAFLARIDAASRVRECRPDWRRS